MERVIILLSLQLKQSSNLTQVNTRFNKNNVISLNVERFTLDDMAFISAMCRHIVLVTVDLNNFWYSTKSHKIFP